MSETPGLTVLPPRHRQAKHVDLRRSAKHDFLPNLKREVAQPDNWLVRADDTKHALADSSILYARVVPSSGRELNNLALTMMRRICGGATQLQSFGRQLNYWCFCANKGDKLITVPVEVRPGKIVSMQYRRYTHRDSRDKGQCTWSNQNGGVNADHMRSTNNGMGTTRKVGTKRTPEQHQVNQVEKKKRRVVPVVVPCKTVNELLFDSDDLVMDLVQHECTDFDPDNNCDPVMDEQDILQCLCMNMQCSDVDADVSIICGDASI